MVANRFETIPRFETERLFLRPLERTDDTILQRIGSDEVFSFVPEIQTPFNAPDWVQRLFESAPPELGHVVIEKYSDELVGYCQISREAGDVDCHYYMALGYWFGEEYWGKGLATEALRSVLNFMLENRWTKFRLLAKVSPENFASRRVLDKLEFHMLDPKPAFLSNSEMLIYEWQDGA